MKTLGYVSIAYAWIKVLEVSFEDYNEILVWLDENSLENWQEFHDFCLLLFKFQKSEDRESSVIENSKAFTKIINNLGQQIDRLTNNKGHNSNYSQINKLPDSILFTVFNPMDKKWNVSKNNDDVGNDENNSKKIFEFKSFDINFLTVRYVLFLRVIWGMLF